MPSSDQNAHNDQAQLSSSDRNYAGWSPFGRHSRAYVLGPMANKPDHNYRAFDAAAERLRKKGWTVRSPSEGIPPSWRALSLQLGEDFRNTLEYQELMARDFGYALWADVLYVLPDWTSSRGARAEALVGQLTGKPLIEYATGKLTGSQVRTTVDSRLFDNDSLHNEQCPRLWASAGGGARCSLPAGHHGPHDEIPIEP